MPGLLRDVAERYGHWTAGDVRTALAFLDWAEEYRGKVRGALDPGEPPRYIGECPVGECEGELYLRAGKTTATCPECGTETSEDAQREWVAQRFEDHLM